MDTQRGVDTSPSSQISTTEERQLIEKNVAKLPGGKYDDFEKQAFEIMNCLLEGEIDHHKIFQHAQSTLDDSRLELTDIKRLILYLEARWNTLSQKEKTNLIKLRIEWAKLAHPPQQRIEVNVNADFKQHLITEMRKIIKVEDVTFGVTDGPNTI